MQQRSWVLILACRKRWHTNADCWQQILSYALIVAKAAAVVGYSCDTCQSCSTVTDSPACRCLPTAACPCCLYCCCALFLLLAAGTFVMRLNGCRTQSSRCISVYTLIITCCICLLQIFLSAHILRMFVAIANIVVVAFCCGGNANTSIT